ncbi:Zinc finger, CCCH-type [Corchorus capsularis]|uniref:Zinc finger, CCCH-type n=1 Tax=Corchorus capsularis TaxID=210143 RepID=A0A1R3ICF2_COCAP|nr:Zinc finger, CCCH-type [Corchorus capsularis]
MEKPTAPSCNQSTYSAAMATSSSSTVDSQDYLSSPLSPPQDDLQYNNYYGDIATDFCSMYNSIFQPNYPLPHSLSLTPSSCSSSEDFNLRLTSDAIATEHRLNQARLILEYQQLCDHYDLCLSRLQTLFREVEMLRRENTELRLANAELIKLLSLSKSTLRPQATGEEVSDWNVKRWERPRNNTINGYNAQKTVVPKSVSVRSCSYVKVNQQRQHGSSNNQLQRPLNPSLRVYVPSEARREDQKAMELEVYNQGMVKTELCNKWQETGTCPYGDHCQFAHGITELRPVIRHPRYKTEVCRMVLAGQSCPYGHRCHFRHSLSDQERLLITP